MDSAKAGAGRTIAQDMVWAKHMLDYTEQVCGSLTDDNMDLRPVSEDGGYFFSAAEQAMHIADSRWSFLGWIDGNDYSEREFAGKYPGKDQPWEFAAADCELINASLSQARQKIDEIMAQPSTSLLETTPGSRKSHEEQLAKARDEGKDTAEIEAAGPATLANVLLFLNSHEQAHRGVLQTILRMNGEDVARVA